MPSLLCFGRAEYEMASVTRNEHAAVATSMLVVVHSCCKARTDSEFNSGEKDMTTV